METYDIDVLDGRGTITVAVKSDDVSRLRRYVYDSHKWIDERDEAREELAELKKMIKELP